MRKLKCIVSIFLLISLLPFSSQAKGLISLLPKLLNNHEEIKAAEAKRDQTRYMVSASKGGWYPRIDISANGGREWVNNVEGIETSEYRNKETLRLTQLLADFGSTKSSINRSEALFEKSKVELEAARQDVLLKGVLAYLGLLKAREKLRYAEESEASIVKQTGMEETIVEHGAGLSSDVLQTKSQLARARALRVSVEGELFVAKNRFKAVFYRSITDEELAAFVMPELPLEKMPKSLDLLLKSAVEHNPRILADKLSVIVADHEMRHSKTKLYPKIIFFAEGSHREDDLGTLGVRNEATVGAEVSYNIFNGFIDRSSVRIADEERNQKASVLRGDTQLIEEVGRNAWQNYLTSQEKHKYLKNQTEIVGEFLKVARKERKLGTRSLLDVLSGEVEYVNAVSQSVAAEIETMEAVYKIFHSMGALSIEVL